MSGIAFSGDILGYGNENGECSPCGNGGGGRRQVVNTINGLYGDVTLETGSGVSGTEAIGIGLSRVPVTFAQPFSATPTVIGMAVVKGDPDDPDVAAWCVEDLTAEGFIAVLSAAIGTTNYFLHWEVRDPRVVSPSPSDDDSSFAAFAIDPVPAGLMRTIWITVRTDEVPGTGTANDPFDGSTAVKFDRLMREQAANFRDEAGNTLPLHVHLGPGTFLTRGGWNYSYGVGFPATYPGIPAYPDPETELGWLVHNDWIIEGSGIGITTVKLEQWPTFPGPAFQPSGIWPYGHTVIASASGNVGYGAHRAQVLHLTVDCNANAITDRPMGVKLNAVHLSGNDTRIEQVQVKHSYGKNFITQTGVSTAVGDPGIVTATAHGLGTNDSVIFIKLLTAVSVANPTVVTSAGHGRRTGESLTISGVVNVTPSINSTHTITVISANQFVLNGVNVTATGAVGASATWTSSAVSTTRINANTFTVHDPGSGVDIPFTFAGSGLSIQWGGGQGESFSLGIFEVTAQGAGVGYPNEATDVTGVVIQDCIVEEFGAGSDYVLAMILYPGTTGNGILSGNTVRGLPGVINFTNAYGVGGVGCQIINNRAENCGALAHFDSTRVTGVLLSHNIGINLFNVGLSITPAFSGALFDNLTISENYFLMDTLTRPSYALHINYIGAPGTSLNNVVIRDNVFRHTGHLATGAYATGLVLVNITGLIVDGNIIESTFDQTLLGNTRVVIRDNQTELGTAPEGLANTPIFNSISLGVPDVPKTGTVTVPPASPEVVGVGTLFNTEFVVGDAIAINNQTLSIVGIADDTHLTLSANHGGASLSVKPFAQGNLLEVFDAVGVLKVSVDQYGDLQAPTTNINAAGFNGAIGFLEKFAGAFTNIQLDNNGLRLYEAGGSPNNVLTVSPGSVLSSGRVFTLTTGDADRTLDLSGGTLTTSNPVTLASDGAGTRTLNIGAGGTLGPAVFGEVQVLSGAGAANLTTLTTALRTSGAAQAITLADGTAGQIKCFVHEIDGGSAVLTPTTKTGFSTVTFTNVAEATTLQWFDTRGWMVLSNYLAVIA